MLDAPAFIFAQVFLDLAVIIPHFVNGGCGFTIPARSARGWSNPFRFPFDVKKTGFLEIEGIGIKNRLPRVHIARGFTLWVRWSR